MQGTTQAEIDDLLQSGDSSIHQMHSGVKFGQKSKIQSEYSEQYEEDFDQYQETRKLDTVSYRSDFHAESKESEWKRMKPPARVNTQNQIEQSLAQVQESIPKTEIQQSRMSRTVGHNRLHVIQEQQPKTKPSKQNKPAKVTKNPKADEKKYLPHNFSKMRDLQKQRLLTTLHDDLQKLKQQNNSLKDELKTMTCKYNAALEKSLPAEKSNEQVLIKENAGLRQKIQSLLQIKKKFDEQNSFSKLSQTQPSCPKEEVRISERQEDLLKFINQLKNRLKDSQANLKSLQLKMNEGLDFQKHFREKVRMIESLEFKIAKLNDQAEADRILIEQLKVKIQQTNKKLTIERQKSMRMEKQCRRVELAVSTNNDMAVELQQLKKEKDNLEKALRELSGSLVSKVAEKNKEAQKKLQPVGHIDVMDFES